MMIFLSNYLVTKDWESQLSFYFKDKINKFNTKVPTCCLILYSINICFDRRSLDNRFVNQGCFYNFFISFGICSTPKLSKCVRLLNVYKVSQLVPISEY